MKPIEPVDFGTIGPKVTNLQLGLLSLLNNQGPVDAQHETLIKRMQPEVHKHEFGEVTREVVAIYQYQLKNWPNYWPSLPQDIADIVRYVIPANPLGVVDAGTAEALNWLVKTFPPSPLPPSAELHPAAISQILQKRKKSD